MRVIRVLYDRTLTMNIKTELACFINIQERKPIPPSELIGHLRNGTISSNGSFVFKKDHKYVVLRHKESGAILYFMVYDHLDTDFGLLTELARSLCASGKAPTDTEDTGFNILANMNNCQLGKSQYDYIGHGTFALMKMKENSMLILYHKKGHRAEARSHYLDALRDEARQELANLFDVQVQIQFNLGAISTPEGKIDVLEVDIEK